METKKLRPADCLHKVNANKLDTQGIRFNDYSINLDPSVVVIEVGHTTTVKIPMVIFERFAKWYLEEQNAEVLVPSNNTLPNDDLDYPQNGVITISPSY